MKIKPLEKKGNQFIKIKLALLFSLIISGVIFSFFVKKPIKNNLPKKDNVLGKSAWLKKNEKDLVNLKEQVLGKTSKFVNQATSDITSTASNMASEAAGTISSLIYDTALKPLIDQIQRLPKDQQEKVKEEICK